MEGVDHIDIVQVSRRSLVSEVYRMLQREVPDREGLVFRIAGADAALEIMVELGQAGRHLTAAGTRSSNDDERTCRLNVLVAAVSVIADDERDVGGIARDGVVAVDLHAQGFQTLLVSDGRRLARELRQNDAAHIQAVAAEGIDQTEHVHIVGDAQVAADLILLDIAGVDGDDDLSIVL